MFPRGDFLEELPAGVHLGLETLVGEQLLRRVGAVMGERFGVPGFLALGAIEQPARQVEIAEAEQTRAGAEEASGEIHGIVAGEGVEQFLKRPGLEQRRVGGRRQVIQQRGPRARGVELGRRGEGDDFERHARALRDGIERADLLEGVAEEIEPAGLVRRDGVDIHDAAAHRVLTGRLAHGLGVVVEGAQQFEQGGEWLVRAPPQLDLARGEVRRRRHGLEQRGGRGEDEERLILLWAECPHPASCIPAG